MKSSTSAVVIVLGLALLLLVLFGFLALWRSGQADMFAADPTDPVSQGDSSGQGRDTDFTLVPEATHMGEQDSIPGVTLATPAPEFVGTAPQGTGMQIDSLTTNMGEYPDGQIPAFEKLELTFQLKNTVAGNFQLPYDPNPPTGIDHAYSRHRGISVDALFLPPGEGDWSQAYRQPAFFYHFFEDDTKRSWDGSDREWSYPTGRFAWKVRFSPHLSGIWQYKLVAQDAGGTAESGTASFSVVPSTNQGFLRTSSADPRYFEFDDGTLFYSHGFQGLGNLDDPVLRNEPRFIQFQENSIAFIRGWISGLYGAAWPEWLGGRNQYDGYLPRPGILPFFDPQSEREVMTMRIDFESDGDSGWFDACRYQFWNDPEAVKQNTTYLLKITYWGVDIAGPRRPGLPHGIVAKIAQGNESWPSCYEPGTGIVVTNYGGSTTDWGTIEGLWNSGDHNFLPRVHLGLENVSLGEAYILAISLREVLGPGEYGPEIINEPSMEYELYVPEQSAHAMDKVVELAGRYDIFLKLVVMDKSDKIYFKMDDDGTFVIGGEPDNTDGFYGLGRGVNKTRWLQQAWWRYLQARWGYSPNIHSWELTNEGDPFLERHHQMTDEFGKFMHCRVFGVAVENGDGEECSFEHPNRHLVTTSFWHSFPGYSSLANQGFWGSPEYPNVDYADVHAYISTSFAPLAERQMMETDAAYNHFWHSRELRSWKLNLPIVRGEAGMDLAESQNMRALGIERDIAGVWFHNFIWATTHSGGLYELYWWWEPHVVNAGVYDHRHVFDAFANFMDAIPLNNGNYEDLSADVSDPAMRAWGQKDLVNGRAHFWVQNKNHTWKNVVEGVPVPPLSATVTIAGFRANQPYLLEWWDTNSGQPRQTVSAMAGADGSLRLAVTDLETDLAVKIAPMEAGG